MTTLRAIVLGEAAMSGLTQALRASDPVELLLAHTRGELLQLLPDAHAVVSDWSGRIVLDDVVARHGCHLKMVQYPGVGAHSVDLVAWAENGVPVCNTPAANAASTAEWVVLAAGAVSRSLKSFDQAVRNGQWPQSDGQAIHDLSTHRVGIVGYGEIGRRAAALFTAFGCSVVVHSRRKTPDIPWQSLEDLLRTVDILVICVPLTPDTLNMFDERELDLLPEGAIVVNVARGSVVNEAALAVRIGSGRLRGALDVFNDEPLRADAPWPAMPGEALLSPHVAGGTHTSVQRITQMCADNIVRCAVGDQPHWIIN